VSALRDDRIWLPTCDSGAIATPEKPKKGMNYQKYKHFQRKLIEKQDSQLAKKKGCCRHYDIGVSET
jgi:hypothetical protein